MARYYDLDKLSKLIEAKADTMLEGKGAMLYVAKWLNLLPTADVEEVVRCKHCNHCERVIDQFDNDWYFCKKTVNNAEVTADHYCGYGERRDT